MRNKKGKVERDGSRPITSLLRTLLYALAIYKDSMGLKGCQEAMATVSNITIAELAEFEKTRDQRIRVRICEFKGYRYLDIRVWINENGGWRLTNNGITFNKKNYEPFYDSLLKADEVIREALNAKTPEEFEKEYKQSHKKRRVQTAKQHKKTDQKQYEFNFNANKEKGGG